MVSNVFSPMIASSDSSQILPAVYIVGAGPGDPELLTVKALKLIQQADVLVYANSLVPAQILSAIRPNAEKIATANMTLEDIVPLMVERVREGKSVVRLHSGDPSLYSAIHEQMLRLSEADVPFEVIPGISAFQAAAARLNVELTVPEQVQSIILTRISGRTRVPDAEELAGLAAHKASLCLYLSARHVEDSQAQLLEHYSPETPVAICFRVGWPDERIWVAPLAQMAAITARENLVRTTLYIVSAALRVETTQAAEEQEVRQVRSRLYNPTHDHLFRPKHTEPAFTKSVMGDKAEGSDKLSRTNVSAGVRREREQGKR